jgi:hypothetical protein
MGLCAAVVGGMKPTAAHLRSAIDYMQQHRHVFRRAVDLAAMPEQPACRTAS